MLYDNYISIGNNCCGTICLRKLNLTTNTLPFDWCITNPYVILECLSNDFDLYKKFSSKIINNENTKEIISMINHPCRYEILTNSNSINTYNCFYPLIILIYAK